MPRRPTRKQQLTEKVELFGGPLDGKVAELFGKEQTLYIHVPGHEGVYERQDDGTFWWKERV